MKSIFSMMGADAGGAGWFWAAREGTQKESATAHTQSARAGHIENRSFKQAVLQLRGTAFPHRKVNRSSSGASSQAGEIRYCTIEVASITGRNPAWARRPERLPEAVLLVLTFGLSFTVKLARRKDTGGEIRYCTIEVASTTGRNSSPSVAK